MAPTGGKLAQGELLAIAQKNLHCALQPIVDARTGVVNGLEALLRGHGAMGYATPVDLLDAFAAAGEIVALEEVLHGKALAAFGARAPGGIAGGVRLFLNLDARAPAEHDAAILDRSLQLIAAAGLAPSSLCVELSERDERLVASELADRLRRMKDVGVRFAAADFGQSRSEIRLLFDGLLDFIKIDKYFIQGVARNERQKIVLAGLCRLAHLLGVRVVAEGVETRDDLVACRDLGCDLVQGWFIAPPDAGAARLPSAYPHVPASALQTQQVRTRDAPQGGLIGAAMRILPAVPDTARMDAVFEYFLAHPDADLCVVVDPAGEPRGVVTHSALRPFAYNRYGRDLLNRQIGRISLSHLLSPCPCVDIERTSADVLDVFLAHPGARAIIVTQSGRYVGLLMADALVSMANERYLAEALDRNPLTRLPGNSMVAAQITAARAPGEARRSDRHICYFDFDHFKPFNDLKGFRQGDRAIVLFAEVMQRRLSSRSDAFFGHLGGDDFVGVFSGGEAETLRRLLAETLEEFSDTVAGLYSADERSRGWIEAADRFGVRRRFPLLRCSVAVLEIPAGEADVSPAAVEATLVELKAQAKAGAAGLAWGRISGPTV